MADTTFTKVKYLGGMCIIPAIAGIIGRIGPINLPTTMLLPPCFLKKLSPFKIKLE